MCLSVILLGLAVCLKLYCMYKSPEILWMQILIQQVGEAWSGAQDAYY